MFNSIQKLLSFITFGAVENKPSFQIYSQLKIGMTSPEVYSLQECLFYLGYMTVRPTGYFGLITLNAVKNFQSDHNIETIGEVGPKTREAFKKVLNVNNNRTLLHDTALACLNTDITPNDGISDNVACAETVNAIHNKAFGKEIGGGPSTSLLYQSLKNNTTFEQVYYPNVLPGDIIISPTGYGNGNLSNGHTGIVTNNQYILSNDSPTGLLKKNYTIKSWNDRYRNLGGFPVFYFRKK